MTAAPGRPTAGAAPAWWRRRLAIRLNHAHGWLYRRTRGRLGGSFGGHRVLLLHTTGRRTGAPRCTPLQFEELDGAVHVVGAARGAPEPPAWWRNLEAHPDVEFEIAGRRTPARARTLAGDERDRAWSRLCERTPRFESLQRRAGRELPVVRLDAGQAASAAAAR